MKRETEALCLALRDAATPWYAKALIAFVLAYALSPIDLIPDFIPGVGQLDDMIIVPAGIALAVKLIPVQVMNAARRAAARHPRNGYRHPDLDFNCSLAHLATPSTPE
ncbi:MAG TPA: YkvA family protein [Anaerolineales bacterium]|nr:YkvA family protein [Anaerolineales bacterium]